MGKALRSNTRCVKMAGTLLFWKVARTASAVFFSGQPLKMPWQFSYEMPRFRRQVVLPGYRLWTVSGDPYRLRLFAGEYGPSKRAGRPVAVELLRVRRVVAKRPVAGGVQLAASGLRVPGPAHKGSGHRERRIRAGQQPAVGPGSMAGQIVHHCAPVEGRSGVHA